MFLFKSNALSFEHIMMLWLTMNYPIQ